MAKLAVDKHDGNMLFSESNVTWDELENMTDGYFDGFAKEDCQIKAASDLVEYLTVDNTTSLPVEMLKMKTSDLSDFFKTTLFLSYLKSMPGPKNGITYYAFCYTLIRKNNTAEPLSSAVLFI